MTNEQRPMDNDQWTMTNADNDRIKAYLRNISTISRGKAVVLVCRAKFINITQKAFNCINKL